MGIGESYSLCLALPQPIRQYSAVDLTWPL